MPEYLRNFADTQAFGKFPRYPGIWEISKILKIYHSQLPIGIWEIPIFDISDNCCHSLEITLTVPLREERAGFYKSICCCYYNFRFHFCLSVCKLYPINPKTAEPIGPKFCVGPHMTPGKVYGWTKFKNMPPPNLKIHEIFLKICELFLLYNVHNWNRR